LSSLFLQTFKIERFLPTARVKYIT